MTDILIACGLTVVIETAFFLLAGYRTRRFILLCVLVNVATNLTLNLGLNLLYMSGVNITYLILPFELLVVWLEYLAYTFEAGKGKKLLLLTLAANALSYLTGLLVF